MTRRRAGFGALSAVVASFLLTLTAGGGIAAEGNTNLRAATVHPALLDQLQANPTGGVQAVITAWNSDALGDVTSIVQGTKLRTLPMVLTKTLTLAQLEQLRGSPAVRSVWPNEKFDLQMEDSTWITKARYVWASSLPGGPQAFGVTGMGVELAVIDTGADANHEDMDNLVEYCDAVGAVSSDHTTVACTPFRPGTGNIPYGSGTSPRVDCAVTLTCDDEGHGSHVSGTVAGTGHASGGTQNTHSTIGMSPHAKLRVYSSNIGPSLLAFQILGSYDDLTFKKENGFNEVVAVNNSWGGGAGLNYDPEDPIHIAIKRAYRAGILSVFAAGNDGAEHDTLSRQCVSPWVVCVAASTKPDSVAMFSSRGRPSQPSDTNRDDVVNGDDVPPDNHDRRLGQATDKIGLYRPALAAPGVNINSISANSPGCREDDLINTNLPKAGCYEPLNGTSMATPHVTGAVGLIVQAFRQGHDGDTPTPAQITDILERSANTSKLPAYESEEQGAGRLDVHQAVRYAKGQTSLRRPNFGFPVPPYVAGAYPGGPGSMPAAEQETGSTKALSWSVGNTAITPLPVEPPPGPGIVLPRYGQHFIDVPEKVDRLRVTVNWDAHLGANLYARLWRPGVNPDNEVNPAGQTRVFPDQEAIGLVFIGTERWLDVRAPEEANPSEAAPGMPSTLPAGQWILRVYHRAGGVSTACTGANENPDQQGVDCFNYSVKVEIGKVTHRPSVRIDTPMNPNTTGRFVDIRGRAGYPPPDNPPIGNNGHSWEGVTNWEVPGSGQAGSEIPDPDNRPVLYMHGNAEEGCSGQGEEDVAICNGPFLLKKSQLSASNAAFWRTGIEDEIFDGVADRNIHDPNWSWCLAAPGPGCAALGGDTPLPGPQTIGGAMTVEWWASCTLCTAGVGISADWIIRVWGDGVLKFEQRVTATPENPGVPSRLTETVNLPTFTANQRVVVHIDPVFVDSQTVTFIYYDSENPCTAANTGRCDSLVRMPAGGTGGGGGAGPAPDNVRVTDLPHQSPYPGATISPALRVAWDGQAGVRYEVYRSTNPLTRGTRVFNGTGHVACTSPEAPSPGNPPGHDRTGRCFTDTGVSLRTTYYYRVVSVTSSGQRSLESEIAYGTPTRYDRSVKLKVDRLYGPQYWEYALLEPSPNPTLDDAGTSWRFLWDTLELTPGEHKLFARSFTQGIGSNKANRNLNNDEDPPPPPPGPGCPDDDDGDGDDDEDDGDRDDDGDDRDDDCEDDEDHEEEDDD
jgi:serine protease AprX